MSVCWSSTAENTIVAKTVILMQDNMSKNTLNRIEFINTDRARVVQIALMPNEVSPKHFHSKIVERVVCLCGSIDIHEDGYGTKSTTLTPGQMHEIPPKSVHYLVNTQKTVSEYLLIQSGLYDFIEVH